MKRRDTSELPQPMLRLHMPVGGNLFVVPIRNEGFNEGYIANVQDEYIPAQETRRLTGGKRAYWQFERRVRVFSKPPHHSCPACVKWWQETPDKQPEVILIADVAGIARNC